LTSSALQTRLRSRNDFIKSFRCPISRKT